MTSQALTTTDPATPAKLDRSDEHPVLVYLARLSPDSRRTLREARDATARTLTDGHHTADTLHWSTLRYQHTAAILTDLDAKWCRPSFNTTRHLPLPAFSLHR